jgi:peptidoglycan/xylan/chitin deacetylase (PgdA/CDA1 family)
MVSNSLKAKLQSSLSKVPRLNRAQRRLVVLCYHSVHPTAEFPNRTPPELFEQHMRWLRQECDVIRFTDVVPEARRAVEPTRPTVAVTFDDGFADNHSHALPILLRYEIPTTFFLATGLIERDPDVLHARSWEGWREDNSTLTWDQIIEMRRLGMDIGSHGHTHRTLAQLDAEQVVRDLSRCKQTLEERLGERIVTFAYPKGRPRRDFLPASVRLARSVGFECAATILLRGVKDSDHPMTIPRFPVAADELEMLRAKVIGRMDLIGTYQERAPLSVLRALGR